MIKKLSINPKVMKEGEEKNNVELLGQTENIMKQ